MNWNQFLLTFFLILLENTAHAVDDNAFSFDLSEHHIAITTHFSGAKLLLFGTADPDSEILVALFGPEQTIAVRRRSETAGFWFAREILVFLNAPSFYMLASSAPLATILDDPEREMHRIGLDMLRFKYDPHSPLVNEAPVFRQALMRLKSKAKHYRVHEGAIRRVQERLFRLEMILPADIPSGSYRAEVFRVVDGHIVDVQIAHLEVSKIGLGATIAHFAHRRAPLYGFLAITLAFMIGGLADIIFRKLRL